MGLTLPQLWIEGVVQAVAYQRHGEDRQEDHARPGNVTGHQASRIYPHGLSPDHQAPSS